MSNALLPPAPYLSPFVDQKGVVTPIWAKWINQIYLRAGGADAPSNTEIAVSNPMTTLGDIPYENGIPTPARLPGNTTATKNFLTQTGTGSVSAPPAWSTIQASDVPTLNQNTSGTASNITASSNSTLTSLSALATASGLTTVGTIGSGTWNATAIGITKGGTGQITASSAFNALSPVTTKGDLIVGNGSNTQTRIGVGSDTQVLIADSAQTTGVKWGAAPAGSSILAVSTKTSDYSLLTSDDIILANPSGAFTLTLPTASGNTGKVFYMKKIADDVANIVTIATTSAQTINGKSSVKLNTFNEMWIVVSDGSNWQVLSHYSNTPWRSNLSLTPNNFGTVATTSWWSRRVGSVQYWRGYFNCGTLAATAASFSFPSGIVIDSGQYGAGVSKQIAGYWNWLTSSGTDANIWTTGGSTATLYYDGSDTAKIYVGRQTKSNAYEKQLASDLGLSSGFTISVVFEIPVSGWDE